MNARRGVSEALLEARGGSVQILIAPTGYGKTSSVHHAWSAVSERWGRVVHVLPLRAIVSDAASKAVERGVPLEEVSYQAAIDEVLTGEGERVRKSSYMFSRYVVTTYDSFSFSLYAAPVAELSRVYAHRDVGLLAAAGGGVLFDEAHLVMATDEADASREECKVFTVLCHEIEVLSRHLQRPVVLATATLPAPVVGGFLEALRGLEARIHLCLGERGLEYYRGYGLPVEEHGLDPDFGKHYEEYRRRVRTRVSRGSLEDDALKALEEYSRVAVFCNTVARAVEVYRRLRDRADAEVILIHGRFTGVDKSGKIDRVELLLKGGGRVLVVSTQVLEAGVDFDFDAVVTEVAAPGALVQRAGRAYRNLEERCGDGGLVTVNVSDESLRSAEAVYPSESVSAAAQYLSSALSGEGFFDWRFAESKPCFVDLLAAVKASPSVDYSLYTPLNDLLRLRLLSENVCKILKELDRWVEGALVRDSALIPIVTERGVVTVSLDYLRGKGRRVLELEDGEAKAVFSDGSYRRVDLQRLFASPLATLYRLAGSGEEFYGLKAREGAYDPEVGLP
ncbi:MAG: CRISPR-associated helicase Cas3' [Thermofilum sp.]